MKLGLLVGTNIEKNCNWKDKKTWLSTTYAKNFINYLNKNGIDYVFYNCNSTDNDTNDLNNFKYKFNTYNGTHLEECSHLVGLEQDTYDDKCNFFNCCIDSICRGSKSIITDSYYKKDIDILFYNIPSDLPVEPNSINILFGCDEKKLIPKKNNDILEILIDHSYYGEGNEYSEFEYSSEILNKTAEFFKSYKKKFIIRRFISNGIEIVDVNKPIKSDIYNRIGLPYDEACEIYNRSHVFVVTHQESLGYSVIECAMAGALIVSFGNFINKNYLNNFHNIIFDNIEDFNWDTIIENIDVQKSRKMAEKFTWDIFFDKIILNLNLFTDKKCNNNKILKKIFNNFETYISIYTDNSDTLENLVKLGYNKVYTYDNFRENKNERYLFIEPSEEFLNSKNNLFYSILNEKGELIHNNLEKVSNIYFYNIYPALSEYTFDDNKVHKLLYLDNNTSIGLQICPLYHLKYNGKFKLNFDAKCKSDRKKKIKIYTGIEWIILNEEINDKYKNLSLECELYYGRSKPRISLHQAESNDILFLKKCIIYKR